MDVCRGDSFIIISSNLIMFQEAVIDPPALIFTQTSQLHKSSQKRATGAPQFLCLISSSL